ncbi:Isochorismatase-like protein [Aspergillus flavus]|uniref:Isochorismatase-like protein n=7 Tax=Aspergillus subgen. Circumdati TaxID=2720871 RepID=A0A7U2R4H5_ASPFN|nr:uncharacterized protein G4B84_009529 [Aspergillus flavus NRRL3357]KAB8245225.1 Isochorismatase-like protein [Aspergillus flavus]OOO08865.1 isochorismatase hydrolase [Aspergillus oryzae]KAF7623301.1 hypothetical protein AFLA_010603 [Aspergillus flavus NRRL3357]KAJ1709974.1 isochorismatase family hydrolase [Aspergillus flavus]QMW34063.1 hypothetical protein G4B84_009529 [Aspergillus flavus NRRL3357]
MSLDLNLPTALVLIDNQAAFTHPTYWGTSRSNPSYEDNILSLIQAFRAAIKNKTEGGNAKEIIHIFHSSTTPNSPLHREDPGNGIQPLDVAQPASDGSEVIMWKCVNSSFIGTDLEAHLRTRGIRQVLFAGLTTDHCVSTTVRMAANLGVVDRYPDGPLTLDPEAGIHNQARVDRGRIILIADATATWAKGGFDAETIHAVSVASLDGEFADIMKTEDVVKALKQMN